MSVRFDKFRSRIFHQTFRFILFQAITTVAFGLFALPMTVNGQPMRVDQSSTSEKTWEAQLLLSGSNTEASGRIGLNVNQYLGAHRFYSSGYTGTRAIVANIEAGHASNTHNLTSHHTQRITGTGASGANDGHATAVTHAMSGRLTGSAYPTNYYGFGISYGAETWSGAIATSFGSGGSFSTTNSSTASVYSTALINGVGGQRAHVFNSSWGFEEPTGNNTTTIGVDGMIHQSGAVGVVAAGNSGSGTNTVGGIAAGYNSISVGALRQDIDAIPYNRISTFSSRSPNSFFNAFTNQTIANARARIDIVAPGENLTLASLTTSTSTSRNNAGTSFAAPIVAGGAALIVDAGRDLYSGNNRAIDGRVVKAVLMNSADKLPNWNNGQSLQSGVIRTTQSLDYTLGAGRMNLDQAFEQYVSEAAGGSAGTTDVAGVTNGDLGNVKNVGWDFGGVAINGSNFYYLDKMVEANSKVDVTLSWFIDNNPGNLANFTGRAYRRYADLNLRVVEFDNLIDRNILGTIAESVSLYNSSEHLSFTNSTNRFLGIQVLHNGNHWNFNNDTNNEFYGVAWHSFAAVPEPGSALILAVASGFLFIRRRR
jgi:hypothetical protein